MKTIKVSEIKGTALDWAVAQCEGKQQGYAEHLLRIEELDLINGVAHSMIQRYRPSTNWAQGGLIIEREGINLFQRKGLAAKAGTPWLAYNEKQMEEAGLTPLVAAMRCYIASKLGETVEVPEELL